MSVEPQGWTPSKEVTSGHYTQIHTSAPLSLSPSLRPSNFIPSRSLDLRLSFLMPSANYTSPTLSLSLSLHRPPTSPHFYLLLLLLRCPLSVFMSSPSSLRLSPGGGRALLSSRPPRERLTSAGCGAKVVPLSLATGASGSLCVECSSDERRGEAEGESEGATNGKEGWREER